jgi:hypothetical protein
MPDVGHDSAHGFKGSAARVPGRWATVLGWPGHASSSRR